MTPRIKSHSALGTLVILAAIRLLLHTLINNQYGFHRDELATLNDARHLAWGYVAYPPFTPFVARIALFASTAPAAIRFFAAFAQCVVMVTSGLIARELGGTRRAQILTAVAVSASPISMSASHLFEYVSFDLMWAVLTVYFVICLLHSQNPHWWIPVGISIGLGLNTRYTAIWLIAGLATGFLVTPARKLLFSRWLVAAIVLAFGIVLPNLIWQANRTFISLAFLQTIHARDIRIGRTNGFLWKQFMTPAATLTVPLWIAGLCFYFRRPEGKPYRAVGFAFVTAMILFATARAREYYTAPLYPMSLAAGAVMSDRWSPRMICLVWAGSIVALISSAALVLPLEPIQSAWFYIATQVDEDLREEIGWPDLVREVAHIRDTLPTEERASLGILTGNYGEAGALRVFGPGYKLPQAMSGANSFWLEGYDPTEPRTLILVGLSAHFASTYFRACEVKGLITNSFGVLNSETRVTGGLRVCRGLREPWPVFWQKIKAWQ